MNRRRLMAGVVVVAAAIVSSLMPVMPLMASGSGSAASSSAACYRPPVDSPITLAFDAPACPYCSGRRGVGYQLRPGTRVTAVASGEVTFAGQVAGVPWVVVAHADGRRASYGHLERVLVRAGQTVASGQLIGLSGPWLHLGVRVGDDYIDPATLLGRWEGRPRLIPANGAPPRPAPSPRLTCPTP